MYTTEWWINQAAKWTARGNHAQADHCTRMAEWSAEREYYAATGTKCLECGCRIQRSLNQLCAGCWQGQRTE